MLFPQSDKSKNIEIVVHTISLLSKRLSSLAALGKARTRNEKILLANFQEKYDL